MVELFFNSMFLSIDAQPTNDDEENMIYQIADKSEPYNIQILNIYLKGLMQKYLDKKPPSDNSNTTKGEITELTKIPIREKFIKEVIKVLKNSWNNLPSCYISTN